MRKILFVLTTLLLVSPFALAQVGGGNITFKTSAGDVVFSHENHIATGAKCQSCHPKPFLTTDQHKKVKMTQMYKGESCGKCHNGKVAFNVKKECKSCHQK
jgi:c(7)-type cytochrome triheme protein